MGNELGSSSGHHVPHLFGRSGISALCYTYQPVGQCTRPRYRFFLIDTDNIGAQTPLAEKKNVEIMKHLYFCRHGESEANLQRVFAGRADSPLTPHGCEQARVAGQHADELSLDLIVASPLIRALETARIIAAEAEYPLDKIVTNKLFFERSWGSLEGKSFDSIEDPTTHPDIESEVDFTARVHAAYEYLQQLDAETILLVGHGSFSRELRSIIDPQNIYKELPNAKIVKLI
jgi:broad specificity phosphatase PhoE